MILSVWLLLSILNLARFSQACEDWKSDETVCEDDVLIAVEQKLKLMDSRIENLSLKIDNLILIINQKCQDSAKTIPNIEETAADLRSSPDVSSRFGDTGRPKNSEPEISSSTDRSASTPITPSSTTSPSTIITPSSTTSPSTPITPSSTTSPSTIITPSSTTSPSTPITPSSTTSPSTAKSLHIPGSCAEAIRLSDRPQGTHQISIPGKTTHAEPFEVSCMPDPNGDGGAWTLIQRRLDGSVDFQKLWIDYVRGFGNLEGEFWLGLQKLHQLTESSMHELWIQMEDFEGAKRWAKYNSFVVGNATELFALKVLGSYTGDAGDALTYHVGQKFSTQDNDNDMSKKGSCAAVFGPWWHRSCHRSNLNGQYLRGANENDYPGKGVLWQHWTGDTNSLKYAHMAIRPYIPSNCTEALRLSGRRQGTHQIRIPGSALEPFDVYCMADPSGDGGAWTLIQRRLDGSVDFAKPWLDYARGFGNLEGEFWLGLTQIHELTKSRPHELWIQMKTFRNVTGWAKYDGFSVGNEKEYFPLKIATKSFRGNVSDKMRYHVGKKFSTIDVDNDESEEVNCAEYGAWWHRACYLSNLNGRYFTPDQRRHQEECISGIKWGDLEECSLRYVHMAIRA